MESSKSIKAYIVEDESKAVALISNYLERISYMTKIGFSRDSQKAFDFLRNVEVDVIFLDINMAHMSGMEMFRKLKKKPFVIFTTAYPDYAVDAFELDAVDYLLKPFSFDRFQMACQRLVKRIQGNDVAEHNDEEVHDSTLFIKSGTSTHMLSWKEIIYLEKDENYVIYHTEKKKILSRQTLNDLQEIFPSFVIRIHKSYAVSLLHVSKVESNTIFLNQARLPIGRTYKQGIKDRIYTFSNP